MFLWPNVYKKGRTCANLPTYTKEPHFGFNSSVVLWVLKDDLGKINKK